MGLELGIALLIALAGLRALPGAAAAGDLITSF